MAFYEGHTAWRTDPIAIAFMFGLKSIDEIEAAFSGQLPRVLTQHFVSDSQVRGRHRAKAADVDAPRMHEIVRVRRMGDLEASDAKALLKVEWKGESI
jgi:hypothetical protein